MKRLSQFNPNRPRANDEQPLGQFLQFPNRFTIEIVAVLYPRNRRHSGTRTGANHKLFAGERPRFSAICLPGPVGVVFNRAIHIDCPILVGVVFNRAIHNERPLRRKMPTAKDDIHPHLPKPFRVVVFLLDFLLRAAHIRHRLLEIRRAVENFAFAEEPIFFRVLDFIGNLRDFEECFRWHATCPKAIAADAVFFYQGGFLTQLRTRHGKHESCAATADNCQIIVCHGFLPYLR